MHNHPGGGNGRSRDAPDKVLVADVKFHLDDPHRLPRITL